MRSEDHLQRAYEAHRAQPGALGLGMCAIRLLQDAGLIREAGGVARACSGQHPSSSEKASPALMAFVSKAPFVEFGPGQMLISEGAESDEIYLLLSGAVRVRRLGAGAVGSAVAGEMVGEVAALARTRRTSSIYAHGDVTALRLTANSLRQLAVYLPAVSHWIARCARDRLMSQLMGPKSIFARDSVQSRKAFFRLLRPKSAPEGTLVVAQGSPPSGLRLVVSGLADTWTAVGHGRRISMGTLGPGDVFGEVEMVLGRPAVLNVEAAAPFTYLELPAEVFEGVMRAMPNALARLTGLAQVRLDAEPKSITAPLPSLGTGLGRRLRSGPMSAERGVGAVTLAGTVPSVPKVNTMPPVIARAPRAVDRMASASMVNAVRSAGAVTQAGRVIQAGPRSAETGGYSVITTRRRQPSGRPQSGSRTIDLTTGLDKVITGHEASPAGASAVRRAPTRSRDTIGYQHSAARAFGASFESRSPTVARASALGQHAIEAPVTSAQPAQREEAPTVPASSQYNQAMFQQRVCPKCGFNDMGEMCVVCGYADVVVQKLN